MPTWSIINILTLQRQITSLLVIVRPLKMTSWLHPYHLVSFSHLFLSFFLIDSLASSLWGWHWWKRDRSLKTQSWQLNGNTSDSVFTVTLFMIEYRCQLCPKSTYTEMCVCLFDQEVKTWWGIEDFLADLYNSQCLFNGLRFGVQTVFWLGPGLGSGG